MLPEPPSWLPSHRRSPQGPESQSPTRQPPRRCRSRRLSLVRRDEALAALEEKPTRPKNVRARFPEAVPVGVHGATPGTIGSNTLELSKYRVCQTASSRCTSTGTSCSHSRSWHSCHQSAALYPRPNPASRHPETLRPREGAAVSPAVSAAPEHPIDVPSPSAGAGTGLKSPCARE